MIVHCLYFGWNERNDKIMNQKPFIHLFQTTLGYYFFDVNTDTIVKIPQKTYQVLSDLPEDCDDRLILKLKKAGLLLPNRKRITKHPETDYLFYQFKSNLRTLLLQVTQDCNQRCDYCVYSGKYNNRVHSTDRMTFEMAKRGIDMVLSHSKDAEVLFFGFYGGEPLLEKELIKQCIEYIDNSVEGKTIQYNITTNGTLLTGDIVELFVNHNVSLMISLDGPAEIHNKNRGFATGEGNPHSIIMKNLYNLKQKYPSYYKEHISFSTVLDGISDFKCIDSFFAEDVLFNEKVIMSVPVSNNYSKNINGQRDQFIEDNRYALFLNLLAIVGRISEQDTSKLLKLQKESVTSSRNTKCFGDQKELPYCTHRNGGCIPGIHKLFLTTCGDFYSCEKVSECSDVCKIGNIYEGVDLPKIAKLSNLQLVTEEECQRCWAFGYCTICLAQADDMEKLSKELILKRCPKVRCEIEDMFKDYCMCKEIANQKMI